MGLKLFQKAVRFNANLFCALASSTWLRNLALALPLIFVESAFARQHVWVFQFRAFVRFDLFISIVLILCTLQYHKVDRVYGCSMFSKLHFLWHIYNMQDVSVRRTKCAYRTTSTNAILLISRILPIHLHVEKRRRMENNEPKSEAPGSAD